MTDCYRATISGDHDVDFYAVGVPELSEEYFLVESLEELEEVTQTIIAEHTDQEGPFRVLYEFI